MGTTRRASVMVAAGIFCSRLSGLVRQTLLAHFLGQHNEADIFAAAIRIPNFLQNLLGEGALSASFIPTYSRMLGDQRDEAARDLAGAVLALLMAMVAVIVLLGELTAPFLVYLLVPGWSAEKRAVTEMLVRIIFPGVGLLVISAWCLGVLNSHRRFLLSYSVGVLWNAAMIVAVVVAARRDVSHGRLIAGQPGAGHGIVIAAAWGAVVGSLLQVLVQWPTVRQVSGGVVLRAWRGVEGVGTVVRTFLPNLISRGANQISAYIDLSIASGLPVGTVMAMNNAQVLYTLPVSLFGMAISAAELPEMSRERGDPDAIAHALRVRLDAATQRLAFYIVPSAAGFICLGGVIAAAIYQTGQFTAHDSHYVWMILLGSSIGLLASTLGRLYASTFYALGDTTTPLRCGLVRVALTGVLGLFAARVLPRAMGWDVTWGATGLTASAGVAGWIEFMLLRRGLCARLGRFNLPGTELAKLWAAAAVAGALSTLLRLSVPATAPLPMAFLCVSVNAICYLGVTMWLDVPESAVLADRIRRILRLA